MYAAVVRLSHRSVYILNLYDVLFYKLFCPYVQRKFQNGDKIY